MLLLNLFLPPYTESRVKRIHGQLQTFSATLRHSSRKVPSDIFMMLALCRATTFDLPLSMAYLKAYSATFLLASRVISFTLWTTPGTTCEKMYRCVQYLIRIIYWAKCIRYLKSMAIDERRDLKCMLSNFIGITILGLALEF